MRTTRRYTLQRWQGIVLMLALLGSLWLTGSTVNRAQALSDQATTVGGISADAVAKIDADVLDALATAASTDIFVILGEQADLSAAGRLTTKLAKSQYVFNTLRAVADRTQKPVRAFLDAQGNAYTSYYISNKIFVRDAGAALINNLAARPDIARIAANHTYQLPPSELNPKTPPAIQVVEPNISFVYADQVWALGVTGVGTVVAGNDTGIQWDHPALINSYRGWNGGVADHNYNWWDATGTYPTIPGDGYGHGTHTTGTMVGDDGSGNQIGMAPGARMIHCKNLDDYGFGTDADIIECFQWDLAPWDLNGANPRPDMAPDVINNSWGGPGGSAVFMPEIDALQTAGILVEFSAGNNGPSCGSLGSPGDLPQVLTTGAVNHTVPYPGIVTDFSSRGPSFFDPTGFIPDIMAPGENVRSSIPDGAYGYASGTSMSGPHVSGLVALMWSANPGLRGFIPETQQLIMQTATPLTGQPGSSCGGDYDQGPNNDWGYGTIDALAAVEAAMFFGSPGTLTGAITDAVSSAPLPGVEVTAALTPDLVWRRTTDPDGIYNLLLFKGVYTVTASIYGYYPQTISGVAVISDTVTTLDIALNPAPTYTVSGVVSDAETGWPLYAEIKAAGYPGAPVWTDPLTGAYTLELAAGLTYQFQVTPFTPGYVAAETPVGPLSGDETRDFALQVDANLCIAPGYAPDFVYFEDFEADNGGFTISDGYTSWAWGQPISGPGTAHSGSNVWATNLTGNYYTGEYGVITSPLIDLSAYSGSTVVVSWWQWLQTESGSDYAWVELSNDGGNSWYNYYWNTGLVNQTWSNNTLYLDSFFAVPDFQIRFGFSSDGSTEMPGFYVDDIGIGVSAIPAFYAQDFEANDGSFLVSGVNPSWEWGTPTRGPGAAHSGLAAWATNLDGDYNDNEASTWTSPVIDLSAAAGQFIQVEWWSWIETELNFDTSRVEFSPDGGANWIIYYVFSGPVAPYGWTQFFAYLDPGYATASFQMRMTLNTDDTVSYPGVYVDDIRITQVNSMPPSVPCLAQAGGLVLGYVTDANTGAALNDAQVGDDAGGSAQTRPTPDPLAADGFYVLFVPPGPHVLTAAQDRYAAQDQVVTVSDGAIAQVDFSLGAGWLAGDPTMLSVTLDMGATASNVLTLDNLGALMASFEVRERGLGYTPAAQPGQGIWLARSATGMTGRSNHNADAALAYPSAYRWQPAQPAADLAILIYADDYYHAAPFTYLDQALQQLGLPYTAYYDANFDGFVSSLTSQTWDLVIFANENWFPAENVFEPLNTYVLNGGRLVFYTWAVGANPGRPLWSTLGVTWLRDINDPPVPVYWWAPDHPIFNDPESVPMFTQRIGGRYGIYGQAVGTLTGGPALAGYTPAATADNGALVIANEGRSVFRGFVDGDVDADQDGDGMPDGVELWVDTIMGIQTEFSVDVPWLATDVISGTLAAYSSLPVQVTFDAGVSEVTQPGAYQAMLNLLNDTPYGALNVPVTMQVNPPADWGKVTGVVSGLARCDGPAAPLAGSTVTIGEDVTLETDSDGRFTYWLNAGSYVVSVALDGYVTQTQSVSVTAGETVSADVELRLDAPCLDVSHSSVSITLTQEFSQSLALTLTNAGAGALNYRLLESNYVFPAALRTPAAAQGLYSAGRATGPSSIRGLTQSGIAEAGAGPLSGWFGGVDNPSGAVRYAAAQCAELPDSFYVISGVDGSFSVTDKVWRYDAGTNDWQPLAPIPQGQEAPTGVCYQGRIYVMGGGGSNQFFIYDVATDQWLAGAPLPRNVAGAAAAAWNGKVYLIGGDDDFYPASGVSDRVDIYDIASDTWIGQGVPLPFGTSMPGAVQIGPSVYVVGGWGVDAPTTNLTVTQRYMLEEDAWTLGPTFDSGRADFALAATDHGLYALGGDQTGAGFFDGTTAAERLDWTAWPAGAWSDLGDPLPLPLTSNMAGFCTTALGGDSAEIWSVGGADTRTFIITGRNLFHPTSGEQCNSIYTDVPWLDVSPAGGMVAPDDQTGVTLTVDAAGLAPGVYHAALAAVSNDIGRAYIQIPVTLTVTPLRHLYLPVIFRTGE